MSVRNATVADAKEIAQINIAGWKRAYRGLLADELIDSLSIEEGIPRQQAILSPSSEDYFVFEEEGKVLWFCVFGSSRLEEFPQVDCELLAIYVEPSEKGRGIGRQLIQATLEELNKRGKKTMLVQVLAENHPSVAFYKKLGGVEVGRTKFAEKYPQFVLAFDIEESEK